MNNSGGILDREIKSLIKIEKFLECDELMIITHNQNDEFEVNGKIIKVISVMKWLLEYINSE